MNEGARVSEDDIDGIVAAMSAAAFYPHQPRSVEVVQTHISWVFLAGEEVYKLKKPVRFSFLDFSTAALRRHFCREEVRLNRRLAPDVYLGVVGIRAQGATFALCDAAAPGVIEVAVRMRRLPHERLLPQLLERGAVDHRVIDAIAARLVAFHQAADAGAPVQAAAQPARLLEAIARDFTEMIPFRGDTIDAEDDCVVQEYCRSAIERHASRLRKRATEGRVREGHGDLHAEHVCVLTPDASQLAIFDCIEFSHEFRCRDVAAEVAFLAMDLELRGHEELAQHFVAAYSEAAADPELPRLIPPFACHRAYIRGKVESLKSAEPEIGEVARTAARAHARRYFALALRFAWREFPALVVVHGLSGSGKSTLARAMAERTGFVHLASDALRKQIAGLAPTDRSGAGASDGLYAPEMSARTYAALFEAAARHLATGRGVILDATCQRRIDREAARAVARKASVACCLVECTAPDEEVERRLMERSARDDDVSDADVAVYRNQRAAYQVWSDEDAADGVRVDTTDLRAARSAAERFVRVRAGGG